MIRASTFGRALLLACLAMCGWLGAQPPAAEELPFEVSADAMPADATGDVVEARGNVRVTRGRLTLTSDKLRYEKKSDSALATGDVKASDGQFLLTCRRLKYYAGPQRAIAWEGPVASRTAPLPQGQGDEAVELSATQITLDLENQRIEGLDRVELTRWIVKDGKRALDFRVRAGEVEIDQVARTSLFRGEPDKLVEIESPEFHARASRAFLEEPLDRLTLFGEAEAWNEGPGGEKLDRVAGAKILHFLKQKRSIVFGSVEGRMRIGK